MSESLGLDSSYQTHMALLQNPIKVLQQIERLLEERKHDAFPGASINAAGNLCRQTAEQIAFLLCVYARMPRERHMKSDGRLKMLNEVLVALDSKEPTSGRTYWTCARKRGPRLAKLVALRPSLRRWRVWFNETSHYSAPGHHRTIGETHVRACLAELRSVIDGNDFGLVVAAYNHIMSDGSITADVTNDPANLPSIQSVHVVRIRDVSRDQDGRFALHAARGPIELLPDDVETRPRKLKGPAIVRGEVTPVLLVRLVNSAGQPVDLSNFEATLRSLMPTERDQRRMQRHMRKLGLHLRFGEAPRSK